MLLLMLQGCCQSVQNYNKIESTPKSKKNKNATKTPRHKISQKDSIYQYSSKFMVVHYTYISSLSAFSGNFGSNRTNANSLPL